MRRNLATTVVLSIALTAQTISATTYVSVEPIPSRDVVGQHDLETILSAGYPNLEVWSHRLLSECMIVENRFAGVYGVEIARSALRSDEPITRPGVKPPPAKSSGVSSPK